jgi:hypothetical protein
VQGLKQKLRERLPEQMVPGVVIEIEEMPKQPNGKVDRQRLMEMKERREEGEQGGGRGRRRERRSEDASGRDAGGGVERGVGGGENRRA